MTDTPTPAPSHVEVTQDDREAAADAVRGLEIESWASGGGYFSELLAQAFARHRLASEARAPAPAAGLVAEQVETFEETPEDIIPRLPSDDRLREVQAKIERLMQICDASKSCMTPEGGAVKAIVYNHMLSALDDAAFLAYAIPILRHRLSTRRDDAERGEVLLTRWMRWFEKATADDDCEYLNGSGWDDAQRIYEDATLSVEEALARAALSSQEASRSDQAGGGVSWRVNEAVERLHSAAYRDEARSIMVSAEDLRVVLARLRSSDQAASAVEEDGGCLVCGYDCSSNPPMIYCPATAADHISAPIRNLALTSQTQEKD